MTNLNDNMDTKRRVVADFKIAELKGVWTYPDNTPVLISGFRRTAMSKGFERFIAEEAKRGRLPITILSGN